jgi:hypothetical protein
MRNLYFIILFFTLGKSQDWASHSGGFLRMGVTARSIAMGGGFTAELEKSFSTFHNPAWASFLVERHIGTSYTNLTLDRRLAANSFAMSLPPTAGIGISWIFAGVNDIQGRYSTGMKSSKMQTGENALMITFAQRIKPWLSIGANFKLLKYDLPITENGQISGSGIGFDIGLLIKTGNYSTFGIMVQDLSSNYQWDTDDIYDQGGPYKENFPILYRVGSRFFNKGLAVVGDIGIITNGKTFSGILPRLGVEYGFLDQYFFRGGYGNDRFAFGVGYEYGLFNNKDSRIDYAYSMDWVAQTAHTISYGFSF